MAGIELDGANQKVVLDADGDTYLEAATDDTVVRQMDLEVMNLVQQMDKR